MSINLRRSRAGESTIMAPKEWGFMYGLHNGNEFLSSKHSSPIIARKSPWKVKLCKGQRRDNNIFLFSVLYRPHIVMDDGHRHNTKDDQRLIQGWESCSTVKSLCTQATLIYEVCIHKQEQHTLLSNKVVQYYRITPAVLLWITGLILAFVTFAFELCKGRQKKPMRQTMF